MAHEILNVNRKCPIIKILILITEYGVNNYDSYKIFVPIKILYGR